jgi:hypothetical protein
MNYVIYEWSVKATDLIVVGTAMTFWVNWGNPEVDFGILNNLSTLFTKNDSLGRKSKFRQPRVWYKLCYILSFAWSGGMFSTLEYYESILTGQL